MTGPGVGREVFTDSRAWSVRRLRAGRDLTVFVGPDGREFVASAPLDERTTVELQFVVPDGWTYGPLYLRPISTDKLRAAHERKVRRAARREAARKGRAT